jgi:uracil-DNA glycosylase
VGTGKEDPISIHEPRQERASSPFARAGGLDEFVQIPEAGSMTDTLGRFVTDLGAFRCGRLVNPYALDHEVPELDRSAGSITRALNLLTYLEAHRRPRLMLVGEAPGYQGCRFSGIAFTSERSLPSERHSSLHPRGWQEPSATIVHRALAELGLEDVTLLWNAVPLHPAGPTPLSNRAPTKLELAAGAEWLRRLLELVQPQMVVAIGRSAERSLPDAAASVRHPAHGGARLFRDGLAKLVATRAELTDPGR